MNERLEMFCDGVFAIAITLLVIEIKVPSIDAIHSSAALREHLGADWPSWFAFLLSFLSLFIAWINHNRLMKMLDTKKTSSAFYYAHGLFILTVIVYPFTTSLLAEYLNTAFLSFPVFIYCLVNMTHAASWVLLFHGALHPVNLAKDAGRAKYLVATKRSVLLTVLFNALMCGLAFWLPMVAVILTALAWIVYLVIGIVLNPIKGESPGLAE